MLFFEPFAKASCARALGTNLDSLRSLYYIRRRRAGPSRPTSTHHKRAVEADARGTCKFKGMSRVGTWKGEVKVVVR